MFADRFISTHSPRVGRTGLRRELLSIFPISTHSPRVGRTLAVSITVSYKNHFNSLAPCGANHVVHEGLQLHHDFNSLAPCGANPNLLALPQRALAFQLTRPVWGEP